MYCILCCIALIHVKIEIWKTTFKLMYMIDYLLFNNTKWDVYLLKKSIMYSKPKLRYGHFKMQQVLYTVCYSSNICKNVNFENSLKIVVHDRGICWLTTLNDMSICWKIQLCTVSQSWDMGILKCNKYCILCSITLIYVKIKIFKTPWKLLYIIDYLLFDHTKWDNNLLKNWIMYLSKPICLPATLSFLISSR